jgi:A/G-specific adenine glycosylase
MRLLGKVSLKLDDTIKENLKPLIRRQDIRDFNQALMELGALVCRPKNPLCLSCLVTEYCQAFSSGEQEIIPSPKIRKHTKIEAVVGIISKGEKHLIQKRPSQGLLAGLWEFPGGKRKPDETRS